MKKLRFVMVGGFLGAGKTTALARLAKTYQAAGRRVGVVTNDQAGDLVDTGNLRSQGLAVEEVAGACFCCRFNELVGKVSQLQQSERPDILLAEPVGSCTDLVATVVQPLRDLYGDRFVVAPYVVLFKPSHGLKILRNETGAGFSPRAAYIFCKQLEEADAIAINRIDEIEPGVLEELSQRLDREFPATPVLRMSAKTGQGFESLREFLEQDGHFGQKILDIDYDIYAAGEAELGWLNASVRLAAEQAFDLDALLLDAIHQLGQQFRACGAEVAHLKTIGLQDATFGVANLVSSSTQPELSLPSRSRVSEAEMIVNARVAVDPGELEHLVRQVVTQVCQSHGVRLTFGTLQSFRPGRPTPTYRYAVAR